MNISLMSQSVPLTKTPHNLQPNAWNLAAAQLLIWNSEVSARAEVTSWQNTEKSDSFLRCVLRRGEGVAVQRGGQWMGDGKDYIKQPTSELCLKEWEQVWMAKNWKVHYYDDFSGHTEECNNHFLMNELIWFSCTQHALITLHLYFHYACKESRYLYPDYTILTSLYYWLCNFSLHIVRIFEFL